jgi:hypothetical protein
LRITGGLTTITTPVSLLAGLTLLVATTLKLPAVTPAV